MPERPAEKGAHPSIAVVVVAGGVGERFGLPGGKQLAHVAGHPVLWWSARGCANARGVTSVVLVCPAGRSDEYLAAVDGAVPQDVPIAVAESGETRQESVSAGLAIVSEDSDLVAIHDGARPLVSPALLDSLAAQIERRPELDGAVAGHPSIDTLKKVDGDLITETPDRASYWQVQTPQVFRRAAILRAHRQALASGFEGTDDAALVEHDGGRVAVVVGPRDNIKVTLPEDIAFVEAALSAARE